MKHHYPLHSLVLADDDPDDHELFKDALANIAPSLNLSIAKSGKDLLNLLRHYIPDFIFLDLYMPGKSGLECLQVIRSNHMFEHTPVIIFSSTTRKANIEIAYGMGADLFLVKPICFKELTEALQAILSMDWAEPSYVKEQYFYDGRYAAFA